MAEGLSDIFPETPYWQAIGKWSSGLMLFYGVVSAQTEKVVEFSSSVMRPRR
jgi:hypothetical protein